MPTVDTTSDLWAWMNTWGDLHEKHEPRTSDVSWRKGYEQAITDLMGRLAEMGVTDCTRESWDAFKGRRFGAEKVRVFVPGHGCPKCGLPAGLGATIGCICDTEGADT